MSSSGQQWLLTSSQADIAALLLSLGACAFLAWVQTKHLTNVRDSAFETLQTETSACIAHFRFLSAPRMLILMFLFVPMLLLSFA
jgi:hypothetical protein